MKNVKFRGITAEKTNSAVKFRGSGAKLKTVGPSDYSLLHGHFGSFEKISELVNVVGSSIVLSDLTSISISTHQSRY